MSIMPLPEGNRLTPEQEAYVAAVYGPNSYSMATQKAFGFTGNQAEDDAFIQQNPSAAQNYQQTTQAQSGGTRTITNPATGETMEVLANDPRIQGLSDAEILSYPYNLA